jgi:hypothetical protein
VKVTAPDKSLAEVLKPDGTRGPLKEDLAVGTQVHYPAPAGSTVDVLLLDRRR